MEDFTDQRKHQRSSRDGLVEAYPVFPSYRGQMVDTDRSYFKGRLRDLSEVGMGLILETHLLAGSVLKFHFDLGTSRLIEIFGTIAWSKGNLSGVKFVSLTGLPQRVIKRYLAETAEL